MYVDCMRLQATHGLLFVFKIPSQNNITEKKAESYDTGTVKPL